MRFATLDDCLRAEKEFWRSHGGFWEVGEFDTKQNTISRAIVRSFRREHGCAWLGNINRHERTDIELQEYQRGMVYNFEFGFVIAFPDNELVNMIKDYNSTPASHPNWGVVTHEKISRIVDRIYATGGTTLNWV